MGTRSTCTGVDGRGARCVIVGGFRNGLSEGREAVIFGLLVVLVVFLFGTPLAILVLSWLERRAIERGETEQKEKG